MQLPTAVGALSALAHGHRLAVFRLLVRAGADGIPAGEIAHEVGVLPNTLSTHLTILGHAGLLRSRRDGRSILYSADFDGMRNLLGFLVADCCDGRPEIFGLLGTILSTRRSRPEFTPVAVGLYIIAAYWFTASTSFANPAVTIARSLSNTFAGIAPASVPLFVVAQLVGTFAAVTFFGWLLGLEQPA